tara:strand:+ start:147 stop:308 length:162 start_codon:yes stop_codon:yes gene_type:complete
LFGNAERNKRGNGSMKEKKRKEKRREEGKKGRREEGQRRIVLTDVVVCEFDCR